MIFKFTAGDMGNKKQGFGGHFSAMGAGLTAAWRSLLAAIIFYTIIPLPGHWFYDWRRLARWLPVVGMILGMALVVGDLGLWWLHVPLVLRSALVVVGGLWLTGGLHLDGAMDTADGLGVPSDRRLAVMADSVVGAYGVWAAIVIVVLKILAVGELNINREFFLLMAPMWARWGQLAAIAFYPYLKPQGKGAFHKQTFRRGDFWLGTMLALGFTMAGGQYFLLGHSLLMFLLPLCVCGALLPVIFLGKRLGGHTGDSYGAVVEWGEVILLCGFTIF